MLINKNIDHSFDIRGLVVGDYFLGCKECWFRYDPDVFAKSICPRCGNVAMGLFDVTEDDILNLEV